MCASSVASYLGIIQSGRVDLSDIVASSGVFDREWYLSRYADVQVLGLSPERHFVKIGQWIGRGISALHPSAVSVPTDLMSAVRSTRQVSYCIPVMNRPDDIRSSLKFNLDQNRDLKNDVEFIVLFFDQDNSTHDWIRQEFADDLRTSYLRLVLSTKLKEWHFCKAKTAFADLFEEKFIQASMETISLLVKRQNSSSSLRIVLDQTSSSTISQETGVMGRAGGSAYPGNYTSV